METKIEITKVKLTKEETAKIEYRIIDQASLKTFSEMSGSYTNMVHKDFKTALAGLVPHMLLITQFTDKDLDKLGKKDLKDYEVRGISIGGDEIHGVVISGRKNLKSGKIFNINTPFTAYELGEDDSYDYPEELEEALQLVYEEAIEYIFNGKKDDSQHELFNKDGEKKEDTEEEIKEKSHMDLVETEA